MAFVQPHTANLTPHLALLAPLASPSGREGNGVGQGLKWFSLTEPVGTFLPILIKIIVIGPNNVAFYNQGEIKHRHNRAVVD